MTNARRARTRSGQPRRSVSASSWSVKKIADSVTSTQPRKKTRRVRARCASAASRSRSRPRKTAARRHASIRFVKRVLFTALRIAAAASPKRWCSSWTTRSRQRAGRLRQRLRLVKRRRRQTLRALRGRRRTKGAERALHLFEPPLHARQPHELDARSDRGRAPAPEEKNRSVPDARPPPPSRSAASRGEKARYALTPKRNGSRQSVARATFPRTRTTRGFGGMCPSFSAIGSTRRSQRPRRGWKKESRRLFFRRRASSPRRRRTRRRPSRLASSRAPRRKPSRRRRRAERGLDRAKSRTRSL